LSFVPIPEALERLTRGEIVIVVDGEDREDEGDLTMAARFATPESLNFMVTHGRGLLCMPCEAARLDALRIGPMVRINDASCDTPFSVPIDHRSTSTGISVHDRATTIRAVLDTDSRPWDFRRPGHVFPLRARERGVLERPGHTEASVDLCRAAGLEPVAVICEVLKEDGAVARVPDLERFAALHDIAIASIDELIEYRSSTESAGSRAALA
jgi:3,4-dihydroxy 2-butanone 4-phosphate synthase / GTP cyclohydrolase II